MSFSGTCRTVHHLWAKTWPKTLVENLAKNQAMTRGLQLLYCVKENKNILLYQGVPQNLEKTKQNKEKLTDNLEKIKQLRKTLEKHRRSFKTPRNTCPIYVLSEIFFNLLHPVVFYFFFWLIFSKFLEISLFVSLILSENQRNFKKFREDEQTKKWILESLVFLDARRCFFDLTRGLQSL